MHIYWAQAFIISKSVIAKIEKISRAYLWGTKTGKRMPELVAWESICLPKNKGGLGLKQLGVWNTVALGKQVWALAMKKDQLWVRWMALIYLKDVEFMDV